MLNICEDQSEKVFIEEKFNAIRAVYIINKNYGRSFIANDFRRYNRKMEILEGVVEEAASNAVQGKGVRFIWYSHIFASATVCSNIE